MHRLIEQVFAAPFDNPALAARHDGFTYLPVIDMPERDPSWTGATGFVNRFFDDGTVDRALGHAVDPGDTSAFLCGNPLMVDAMMNHLGAFGFRKHTRREPGQLFVEEYWKDDS